MGEWQAKPHKFRLLAVKPIRSDERQCVTFISVIPVLIATYFILLCYIIHIHKIVLIIPSKGAFAPKWQVEDDKLHVTCDMTLEKRILVYKHK